MLSSLLQSSLFMIIHSKKNNQSLAPCHRHYGPEDTSLRCDSSHHQIIFPADKSEIRKSKQKRNLVVFDIDLTILESMHGFHKALPIEIRENKVRGVNIVHTVCSSNTNLELLFMHEPCKYSIVFRRAFFNLLEYFHTDSGFVADLILYTRARPIYAQQVTIGIHQCYNSKYESYDRVVNSFVYLCLILLFIEYSTAVDMFRFFI